MKLVFATHNLHKLKEIRSLMPGNIELLSLEDLFFTDEIEETAATMQDNALLKARYIAKKFHIDCFADDTGLEVEALNGAPGVYSARYAGPQQDDQNNMKKLLIALSGHTDRKACFKTVIALVLHEKEHIFEGRIDGDIITEKQGAGGFGYDPIFRPVGYSKTFAQMEMDEKNKISHRALAVNKLVDFLKQYNP